MFIENEYLKVGVTLNGGSMTSIFNKKINKEVLYQKDVRSWMGQDVVIFPFIGGLKDKEYIVDEKVYSMKNHGLIRYVTLDVVLHNENELVLGYKYNEETLLQYPYKFYFEICYRLEKDELTVEYRIYNLDNKDLYFNLGGHPALIVNGYEDDKSFVYENVKLIFEKKHTVKQFVLNEQGSLISEIKAATLSKELVISKDIIEEAKTLIYDVSEIDKITLISGKCEYIFDISKCNILAIWSKTGFGNFLCVEPWWGVPDFENTSKKIEEKILINKLGINEKFITNYKIKVV